MALLRKQTIHTELGKEGQLHQPRLRSARRMVSRTTHRRKQGQGGYIQECLADGTGSTDASTRSAKELDF